MTTETLAIVFGLLSAGCWGAGDFSGGLAGKRNSTYTVVIVSQLIGMALLILLALFTRETVTRTENLWVALPAGVFGGFGLLMLYRGLAEGRMGLVAPITALVTAILPVSFSFVTEGLPAALTLAGCVLALIAAILISLESSDDSNTSKKRRPIQLRDLQLPILAGLGFGTFFILIDTAGADAVFIPLIIARVGSMTVLTGLALASGQLKRPDMSTLPIIALAGFFDTGGNAFFVLAAQSGRLDVATILSSLFPAGTVLLAWLILREQLARHQIAGIMLALVAIVLITL